MVKEILVLDDDLAIVDELKTKIRSKHAQAKVVGPPKVTFEVSEISRHLPNAAVVILDLNLGGTGERGLWLLDKLADTLKKQGITVIVWSKYIARTTVYMGKDTQARIGSSFGPLPPPPGDERLILRARKLYSDARGFVSKLVDDPADEMLAVLEYLHLLGLEEVGSRNVS